MPYLKKLHEQIARVITEVKAGRHHDFIRSSAILVRGNAAAQIILLGTVPLLTRLFEPKVFGVFALFSALTAIIARIGSLCYERAIVLPKEHDEAFKVVILSAIILLATVIVTAFVVIPLRHIISESLGSPDLHQWLMFVPIGVGLTGLASILRNWSLRRKKFQVMSSARVLEALLSSTVKIGAGFFLGSWAGGLVLGMISGSIIAVIIFLSGHFRDKSRVVNFEINRQVLITSAKFYKTFPLYATWNALMNILSVYILLFLISVFFGPAAVGLYNLSYRVMQQPIEMITQSVANVYFQKAAEQASMGRSARYGFKKAVLVLFSIGIVPMLFFVLYGREIFGIIFGQKWEEAGLYAQILSPWFFIMFISGPVNIIFEVYQKQKIKLFFNGASISLSAAAICAAYWMTSSIEIVLAAFTTVNVIMGLVLLMVSLKIIR